MMPSTRPARTTKSAVSPSKRVKAHHWDLLASSGVSRSATSRPPSAIRGAPRTARSLLRQGRLSWLLPRSDESRPQRAAAQPTKAPGIPDVPQAPRASFRILYRSTVASPVYVQPQVFPVESPFASTPATSVSRSISPPRVGEMGRDAASSYRARARCESNSIIRPRQERSGERVGLPGHGCVDRLLPKTDCSPPLGSDAARMAYRT